MKDSDCLYIFFHIPKCAGSSIRKHIENNFSPDEAIFLEYIDWRLNPDLGKTHKDYLQRASNLFSRFTKKEKDRVKIIYGHTAPWGIHKSFKRKARYFTFVRKPSDRVLSMYNFFRFRYAKETPIGKKDDTYYHQLLIGEKVPSFKDWYKKKYGMHENITDTMCQFLKNYGYIEGKINASSINEALNKFYFVGTVDNFTRDSYFLYSLLGMKRLFWKQNISYKYLTKVSIDDKDKIKNDTVLYNKALEAGNKFKKTRNDFSEKVAQMEKLRYLIPFNQVKCETKQTIIDISNYFRRKSKVYTKMFNYARGKN